MVEQEDSIALEEEPPLEFQQPHVEDVPETTMLPDTPGISFHALTGQVVPSTLKIAGHVQGKEVIVLVDGGSTNNFV